jgi:membrane protein DedA with SNARE-associated domain
VPLAGAGYLGIALLICLEGMGIPAPGQTAMIAAAAAAGTGHLNFAGVVATGLIATLLGNNLGYLIGHQTGRRAVLRWGRHVRLTEARWTWLEEFMRRRGPTIILSARFIEGFRQLSGLICGTIGIPWRRFAPFDALGAVAWVVVWTGIGHIAGAHLDEIKDVFRQNLGYALAMAFVLVVGYLTLWWLRRRRHAGPDAEPRQAP